MSTAAGAAPSIPRGPLAFILLTILMDVIGFGLIIPVLPTLVAEVGHVDPSKAAGIGGWLIMSYALAQFLFSPVLGGLSDAYGRRPVLLISMAGFAINMLIVAFAHTLWLLFLARILAGMTGASIATANAYIADITPHERRAQTFGLLGVAFGVGFVLGPAMGGVIGAVHPRWPFLAAAALAGLNMASGYFLLPESHPRERRQPFDWKRANVAGSLGRLGRLGGDLRRLAIVYFLWMLAMQALQGIWSYVAAYRYSWAPFAIGLSLTFVGVMAVLVNGFGVRRAVSRFGERKTAILGIAGGTASYVIFFFADQPLLAYVGLAVSAVGGLTVPSLQAMMTHGAAADRQGELQGALSTLASLTIIIGPPVFAYVFTRFSGEGAVANLPGMPFALSALLTACALALLASGRPSEE